MRHQFTDDQIYAAKHSAALHMNRDWVSRFNARDIRAFLDALPEPEADDWQECRFEDIRKGDRVKNVLVRESGQIHTKEGVANRYEGHESGVGLSLWFMGDHDQYIARSDEPHGGPIKVTLYRIPAPVQHPDPLEYPAIIDLHTTGDEVFDYAVWDSEDFYLCYTHEGEFMRVAEPSEITKFTPAKVVEDDR